MGRGDSCPFNTNVCDQLVITSSYPKWFWWKKAIQNEYHIIIGLMDSTTGQITTGWFVRPWAPQICCILISSLVMYTDGRAPMVTFHFLRIFCKGLFLEKKSAMCSQKNQVTCPCLSLPVTYGWPCAMLVHQHHVHIQAWWAA